MALDGDLNIKAAATKAGYSAYYAKNRAYTLLEHAKIRARIQEIQADAFKKAGLSPQEILRRIARIADTAEGEDDFPAALRALEMLGKHFALFTDKHVHENREDSFKTGTTPEDRKRDVSNLLRVVPTDRLKQIAKEKND
jgi:phage terminase small subunit